MEKPFGKRKHDSRDLGVAFCDRHAGTSAVSKKIRKNFRKIRLLAALSVIVGGMDNCEEVV